MISVIISTYNNFEQVKKSIISVMKQSILTEIIIVNNCSTDKKYIELNNLFPQTKVIQNDKKLKYGLSLNEGIKVSQGEWICFLDDTDYYIDSDKIKQQIKLMKKYKCLMSSSNMLLDKIDNIKYFNNCNKLGKKLEKDTYLITYYDVLLNNYISNSSIIIHKNIIDKVGLFFSNKNENHEYWLKALKYTNCIFIDKPLLYYDIHID